MLTALKGLNSSVERRNGLNSWNLYRSGKGFKVSALTHTLGDVGRLKLTATTSQIHSNSFFRPNLTKQGDAGLQGVGV